METLEVKLEGKVQYLGEREVGGHCLYTSQRGTVYLCRLEEPENREERNIPEKYLEIVVLYRCEDVDSKNITLLL